MDNRETTFECFPILPAGRMTGTVENMDKYYSGLLPIWLPVDIEVGQRALCF